MHRMVSLYMRLTRFQHRLGISYELRRAYAVLLVMWLYQYPTQTMKPNEIYFVKHSGVITSKHKSRFEVLSFGGGIDAFERGKRSGYELQSCPAHAKYKSIFSIIRNIASIWQSDLSRADVIYLCVLPMEVEYFSRRLVCLVSRTCLLSCKYNVFFSNSYYWLRFFVYEKLALNFFIA